jgi:hypothetical protein
MTSSLLSARIDLTHGGGTFGRGIDRSKPSILNPYMQDREWEAFCDDIDTAIESVAKAMKCAMIFFGIAFASIALVILVSFVVGFSSSTAIFVVPASMVIAVCSVINAAAKSSKALGDMNRICKEASDRHPSLTFRFKFEEYHYGPSAIYSFRSSGRRRPRTQTDHYIEVSLDEETVVPTAVPTAVPTVEAIVLPSEPISASASEGGTAQTAQDRMNALESVKHLLSEEEYERKRAEIIASI